MVDIRNGSAQSWTLGARLCAVLHEEQQWILGHRFCGKWLDVSLEGPRLRALQVCPLMFSTDSQGGSAGLLDGGRWKVPGGGHS